MTPRESLDAQVMLRAMRHEELRLALKAFRRGHLRGLQMHEKRAHAAGLGIEALALVNRLDMEDAARAAAVSDGGASCAPQVPSMPPKS